LSYAANLCQKFYSQFVYWISVTSLGQRKGIFIPTEAIKACREGALWFHAFLTSALDKENDNLHASAALAPKKVSSAPIVSEAGWAPEPIRTLGKEKTLLSIVQIESQSLFADKKMSVKSTLLFCRLEAAADAAG
jgi:hypothetical protein